MLKETLPSALSSHSPMASSSALSFPVQPSTQQVMHKNRLQEFAQKTNIALPLYQTINEGPPHAPSFRSTVWVDGMSYTSQSTFSHRKTAEQDAARLAMKFLSKRTREEVPSLVCKNSTFCKSILNEYATKLGLDAPTYSTLEQKGSLPFFISTLVFNDTSYSGDADRNKKSAEQLAARAAILSILGNSDKGAMLCEMIKSKSKLYNYNTVKGKGLQDNNASAVIPKHDSYCEATKVSNVSLQRCSAHVIDGGSSLKKQRKN